MPVQESYRQKALEKLSLFCKELKPKIRALMEGVAFEDFRAPELEGLWKEAIEENHYMEVVFTEIMEHHDGAYLRATFRNALEDCYAERYVSVWSSGRVELSYAFFVEIEGIKVKVEKKEGGLSVVFAKSA